MIFTYFKTSVRNLVKVPVISTLNIFGLAVGVSAASLIFMYSMYELSFDQFYPDKERIFRIVMDRTMEQGDYVSAHTPGALAPVLREDFFEVESVTRVIRARKALLKVGQEEFFEDGGLYAEPGFLKIFPQNFLQGNPEQSFNEPNQIIISEGLAIKYFGNDWNNKNIIDSIITADGRRNFSITGVISNPPRNSHLSFDYIVSWETAENFLDEHSLTYWGTFEYFTYLKILPQASINSVREKMDDLVLKHLDPITLPLGFSITLTPQPLSEIHLYSADFRNDFAVRGDIDQVVILVFIGLAILLLGTLNFVNLSIASSMRRIKEVGIRKTNGAGRKDLVLQFIGETFLVTTLSFIVAAFLLEVTLPLFNYYFKTELAQGIFNSLNTMGFLIFLWFTISLITGAYPAAYLTGFSVQKSLKASKGQTASAINFSRKTVVVVQLAVTAFLLAFTLIINRQVNFMQSKELGFNKDQLMVVPMRSLAMLRNTETVKTELLAIPGIESVAASSGLPGYFVYGDGIFIPEQGIEFSTRMMFGDKDFIATLGMELVSGRNFNDLSNDIQGAFIINERAAQLLGWSPDEAIGKRIDWEIWVEEDTIKAGQVIGVVKDFHFRGMKQEIEPLTINYYPNEFAELAIKIGTGRLADALPAAEQKLRQWNYDLPVDYHFLDEDFERTYQTEMTFGFASRLFTSLAIVVACLGLLGLSILFTQEQMKAMSIRKVFGATAFQIFLLLNSFYLRITLIGCIIGLPISYLAARNWLANYAYRVDLGIFTFLAVSVLLLAIALGTISYQALKASQVNPAKMLSEE